MTVTDASTEEAFSMMIDDESLSFQMNMMISNQHKKHSLYAMFPDSLIFSDFFSCQRIESLAKREKERMRRKTESK